MEQFPVHQFKKIKVVVKTNLMKKKKVNLRDLKPNSEEQHSHDDGHDHGNGSAFKTYIPAIISFVMLMVGIAVDYFDAIPQFEGWIRVVWYTLAYIPVGFPVIKEGWKSLIKGDVFTEFFLMSIATIGAFIIGEYPEGVAVMLFYAVGELFQNAAVNRAKGNIKALLDVRPKEANVFRDGDYISVSPEAVNIGEKIQIRVGEKIPLDGILLSEKASLNTAALTGESKPDSIQKDAKVYAGSINLESVIEVEVTNTFEDSSIARILDLVQNATARKSKTELFIRQFARIYTPIVVFLAIGVTFIPYFFVDDYVFRDWLYRALIFLVISCPCALVISIPLGYFGGLGAASKNGILFKGASFLDAMTKINTLVMDKTGTVTKGVFKIKEIKAINWDEKEFMKYISIAKKDLNKIESIYLKLVSKKVNSKKTSESKVEELEKLDVTEEIDRTNSHFNQIVLSVKSKDLSGKKISFILQEINRESNTILSKFLDNLTGAGLINKIEYDGKNTFVITSKGRQYLDSYVNFSSIAESFGLEL